MNSKYCRIGQKDRCSKTGCEWKKSFRHYCEHRPPEEKILTRKKPGRVVKGEIKYIEFSAKEKKALEKNDEIWNKIGTVKNDPWISKIKTV